MFHKFRLETDEENPASKRVYLDGEELHGVTAVDIRVRVDEMPTVVMEIMTRQIEINTEAEVTTEELLNQPMEFLNLSKRAYNSLRRGSVLIGGRYAHVHVRTIGDVLREYQSGRLKRFRMMGDKALMEVAEKLCARGLIGGEED